MKSNRWFLIVICVLLLLWLRAEWRLWQLNSEINRVYFKAVTIKAIDADTRAPLPIVFHSKGLMVDQHWPKMRSSSTGDDSEIRVEWIDIDPVEVGVSSKDYTEQRLQLDQHSEDRIVVYLRRSR